MDTETKPLWTTTREAMGKTWTIELHSDDFTLKGASEFDAGRVWHSRQKIAVNGASPNDGRDESLMHEIMHLVMAHLGRESTEEEVTQLASSAFAYLRGFGLWQPFPWPDKKESAK